MSEILRNLDWSVLTDMLLSVLPAVICVTVHECCHGLAALKMGDTTAKDMGRLSLNPFKHIDILGLVMMALVGFGWAKPVPVNMYRFKNPKRGMMLTALAGPVSNLLLAAVMLFLYGVFSALLGLGTVGYYVLLTLFKTAYLSIALAVFNLIPIPPLDGSKVLFSCLSHESYHKLMQYERYGMIILVVLLMTDVLNAPLNAAVSFMLDKMMFLVQAGFMLVYKLL